MIRVCKDEYAFLKKYSLTCENKQAMPLHIPYSYKNAPNFLYVLKKLDGEIHRFQYTVNRT